MNKTGWAIWKGSLKEGMGTVSTETGVLTDAPYGFKSRFESGPGTNPEELLAAAHAACFSMALSLELGKAQLTAESIETHAKVTLEKMSDGFEITAVHLSVEAEIPGMDTSRFTQITQAVKNSCPVSKVLKANITLEANLSNETEKA